MTFGKIIQIVNSGTKFEMQRSFQGWGYAEDFPQCIKCRVFTRYALNLYRGVVNLFKWVQDLLMFSQEIENWRIYLLQYGDEWGDCALRCHRPPGLQLEERASVWLEMMIQATFANHPLPSKAKVKIAMFILGRRLIVHRFVW